MVLHPTLAMSATHRTTRDINFIKRSFISEMRKYGFHDVETKLRTCINGTAVHFGLGADWLNGNTDVVLPMAEKYVYILSQTVPNPSCTLP